jgi:hypothetical protein
MFYIQFLLIETVLLIKKLIELFLSDYVFINYFWTHLDQHYFGEIVIILYQVQLKILILIYWFY